MTRLHAVGNQHKWLYEAHEYNANVQPQREALSNETKCSDVATPCYVDLNTTE